MNKKTAMSPMGYAIVTVILIAIGMIITAPMIIENQNKDNHEQNYNKNKIERKIEEEISQEDYDRSESRNSYYEDALRELENRLNNKIENLSRNTEKNSKIVVSDKYICSIEGGYDEQSGVVVPINPENPPAKFVFVCEYKK